MKYKLYENGSNDTSNVVKEVLNNREIKDWKTYLNLNDDVILPYSFLDNLTDAVNIFMKHFNNDSNISILVDEDVDGFCSASMMYLYIKKMNEDYPVNYILHNKPKAHGLSDDVIVPKDTRLLIIPDAGTNDVEQCKELSNNGVDIIILDHHEKEYENPYAIIVNNQISKRYINKDLCGAGVVYKFLQALDDENWNEFSDEYLDLFALANIGDVMDMRSYETRYLTDLGLLNIKNKFFSTLIESQDYLINGKINIHNVQWYCVPVINSMIRIGSCEDKEILFRAFIGQDELFEYKKRATKNAQSEIVQENIYERAVRLCKNTKSRQDRSKERSIKQIAEVASTLPSSDKVIMIDSSNMIEPGMSGVVAIKIAEMFNKPCILINKFFDPHAGKIVYSGSGRNVNHSPIDNFKDIVNSTGILSALGHASAFGIVGLDIDKKNEVLEKLNKILKDVEYDSTYRVDFILDVEDVSIKLITELSKFEDIICQGIEEPIIAVENIIMTKDQFEIIGKNEDTISFIINEIKYIQFRCKSGNQLYDWLQDAWDDNDEVVFDIVGKPSINEYNGIKTPQIIIEDILVTKTYSSSDNFEW